MTRANGAAQETGKMLLHRFRYLVAKTKRAWRDKTLHEKSRRFLAAKVFIPWRMMHRYARLPRSDRQLPLRQGCADHRPKIKLPTHHEVYLRRIVTAYKASKEAAADSAPEFQIRGLWAEWIDLNYRKLIAALMKEDLEELAALYGNFNREQFTIGTGGSGYDGYLKYKSSLTGRQYLKTVWCEYRDKYLSLGLPVSEVRMPYVGNPVGVAVNGDVIQINTFRHAYHALEICEWLRGVDQPLVAEIGSGVGGQAFQTVLRASGNGIRYVCFDIPEVASVCSYFLLCALPERRIRLFGEGPVSAEDDHDYDVAVFPHFACTQLADESVDLFHNANSFSEMDSLSASAYLTIMERTCRRYISHINHEVSFRYSDPEGSVSENIVGSRLIPDPKRFKRVFKKPRVFGLPEDVFFPSFEYLYERC